MSTKAKILLIVSFGLNMVLVAGFWMSRSTPQVAVEKPVAETAAPQPKLSRAQRAAQTITVTRETALDWTTVESADYRAYIENLRAIGCPEATVRDIIIADINALYASKVAALYPSPKEFKFWRVEDRAARLEEREREEKRDELAEEKRELIKELLGVDYDAEIARWSGRPNEDAYRYGFLSPEKQEQTKELYNKYREMERELFREGGGMTAENRAKFMSLRAEREAELAKLLGPQDFEEYQLRNSYTARNMRENLAGFQPDEDEFRKIFELKKSFDDQFGFMREGGDEAVREERRLAQQKLDEQLLATLGTERFQQYQLNQDPNYREEIEFAQRYNIQPEVAKTIYDVRIAAEQERNRIRHDATLDEQARVAALNQLAQLTQSALQPTLGDNWSRYQERNRWVTRLNSTGGNTRDDRNSRDRRGR